MNTLEQQENSDTFKKPECKEDDLLSQKAFNPIQRPQLLLSLSPLHQQRLSLPYLQRMINQYQTLTPS